MKDSKNELREFVETITNENRDFQSLHGPIMHYGVFIRNILHSERPSFIEQRNISEPSIIESGIALTPWHAAACIEDRVRTAAFIRGAIRAVENALDTLPHRPLHLLEAGCGPLGTLILPLLSYFSKDDLEISIIDLHQESIDSTSIMIDHFGYSGRLRQMVCGDASNFIFDTSIDIILSETMHVALSREPQVAISLALMQQHPGAVLIPENISVNLEFLDYNTEINSFPMKVGDRTHLGNVIELNAQTALELKENDGIIALGRIPISQLQGQEDVLCLTTKVQVYGSSQFRDYDSQITYPIPLQLKDNTSILAGDLLQFSYRLGNAPGIICEKVEVS